ncbi:MAG: D-alanyl-D-alanine carboxypeptidase family protein [Eubacteriales bacterium]
MRWRMGAGTRFLAVLMGICLLFFGISPMVPEAEEPDESPPTVSAQAAILRSADGVVLYTKNSDVRLPMASTTKIMTALVAIEQLPADSVITVPKEAVGVEGSSAYLIAGEQITLTDLLYALLLQSANDAATAIAIAVSGSVESFAELMNKRAKEMGLTNTHFCNPHGLDDPDHYTSAADLAEIAACALQNPEFRKIVSERKYVSTSLSEVTRWFTNHNRMLMTYDGAIGVKTGYTMRTGRCLVSAAERDGLTLIAVTLRDPDDWRDHTAMLDYGYSCFEKVTLATPGEITAELLLEGGVTDRVRCSNRQELTVWMPKGTESDYEVQIQLPNFEYAPVSPDEAEGKVLFLQDGRVIGTLELYPEWEVQAEELPPTLLEKIASFFLSILRFVGTLLAKRAR